jgi:hypothetical protein
MKRTQFGDRREIVGLSEPGRRQDMVGRMAAKILNGGRRPSRQHEHVEAGEHGNAPVAQIVRVGRCGQHQLAGRMPREPVEIGVDRLARIARRPRCIRSADFPARRPFRIGPLGVEVHVDNRKARLRAKRHRESGEHRCSDHPDQPAHPTPPDPRRDQIEMLPIILQPRRRFILARRDSPPLGTPPPIGYASLL